MSHFNICPYCMHRKYCVLTAQKDKVWSCSEFDERIPNETINKNVENPKQELELV